MESVSYQWVFNVSLTAIAFLGGWVLNSLREANRDLREDTKTLTDKVQKIEILVAGSYITRDELDRVVMRLSEATFRKLDSMEEKLDAVMQKT